MTDDSLGTPAIDEVDDEPLGTVTEPEEPESRDITRDPDPEDFDFDEFIAGVRPGRRAVKVTMRADLSAELDHLIHRAEELPKDMEPEERKIAEAVLLDEFEAVKAQILASQRVFVVEARSSHRTNQIIKRMEKVGLPKPGKKATEEEVESWNNELGLHRLADAIVVPSNVTVEGLRKLDQVAEAEIQKLFGAFIDASQNPTKAVTPNFSLRR